MSLTRCKLSTNNIHFHPTVFRFIRRSDHPNRPIKISTMAKVIALLVAASTVASAGVLPRGEASNGWGDWNSCTPSTIYTTEYSTIYSTQYSTIYSTATVPTTVTVSTTIPTIVYKPTTYSTTITVPTTITQPVTITAPPVTETVTYTAPCESSKGWGDWKGQ
jgi:hypothetical protein